MNAGVERSARWWPVRLLARLAAPAAQVPELEQSGAQRARVDTSMWVTRAPIRFGLVTTASVAASGPVAAWVASELATAAQVGIAVGAACAGFIAPVAVVFAIEWVAAFPRQRNEAREQIGRLTRPADVADLARDFADWVVAKNASLPRHGFRMMPNLTDANSETWLNHEKREDEIASLQARARAEYHERFRAAVADVLGTEADDPKDIAALEELAQKLTAIAESEEKTERIAAARGQPVGAKQRALLDTLLQGVQLAVANERAVDYGDTPAGQQPNRASFTTHFASVMPALETWHAGVERLEASIRALRDWIPQEVRSRGFAEPDYFNGTVAECFSEITVGRARRHELDEACEIHLRCVEDVTTTDGEKRWSAYLHTGQREIKVAELSHQVEQFSEVGMAELNEAIATRDRNLQACFDAIQSSEPATEATNAEEALRALREPLLEQLRRHRITANPIFSASCPYCLAEIGL